MTSDWLRQTDTTFPNIVGLDCKTVGFFFLKISKEIGKAWRKGLTRAKCASERKNNLALCFQPRPRPFVWLLARTWILFAFFWATVFHPDDIWGKNCHSKKRIKQCLGGLKCSQNTKKNKKTLKVSFKAIFNVHFANLVSKKYFSIQRLIIFLLYE